MFNVSSYRFGKTPNQFPLGEPTHILKNRPVPGAPVVVIYKITTTEAIILVPLSLINIPKGFFNFISSVGT